MRLEENPLTFIEIEFSSEHELEEEASCYGMLWTLTIFILFYFFFLILYEFVFLFFFF